VTTVTLALVTVAVIGVTSLLDHTLTRVSKRDAAQGAQSLARWDSRPSRPRSIETAEELEQIAALGCDAVQGFFLARPMAESDLRRWLAEHGHELAEPGVS
jgi:predicted signal transduction protein with EAL and GGDEF domain